MRPRPPYLSHERNRHGAPVWYVRVGGKRIRIRDVYGTPEFDAAYQAALTQARQPQLASGVTAGSLQWLIDQYRDTSAWQNLSKATRRQREAANSCNERRAAGIACRALVSLSVVSVFLHMARCYAACTFHVHALLLMSG